jgi:FtsH-binding integral membrane protein
VTDATPDKAATEFSRRIKTYYWTVIAGLALAGGAIIAWFLAARSGMVDSAATVLVLVWLVGMALAAFGRSRMRKVRAAYDQGGLLAAENEAHVAAAAAPDRTEDAQPAPAAAGNGTDDASDKE